MKALDEVQLKQLIEYTEAIRKNTSLVVLGAKNQKS